MDHTGRIRLFRLSSDLAVAVPVVAAQEVRPIRRYYPAFVVVAVAAAVEPEVPAVEEGLPNHLGCSGPVLLEEPVELAAVVQVDRPRPLPVVLPVLVVVAELPVPVRVDHPRRLPAVRQVLVVELEVVVEPGALPIHLYCSCLALQGTQAPALVEAVLPIRPDFPLLVAPGRTA